MGRKERGGKKKGNEVNEKETQGKGQEEKQKTGKETIGKEGKETTGLHVQNEFGNNEQTLRIFTEAGWWFRSSICTKSPAPVQVSINNQSHTINDTELCVCYLHTGSR